MNIPQFLSGWVPALAVTATVAPPVPEPFSVVVQGMTIPLVTCALGAMGMLAARPLARRKERELPLSQFLLVTGIMLVVVELWVVQFRPNWLFAFVLALGLGFSGYSLIELLGDQLKELVKAAFDSAKSLTGRLVGGAKADKEQP